MGGLDIGYAILIGCLIFFIYPAAKYWLKNSPKAEKGDWEGFLFPIVLVIAFIGGLMWLVSR